MKKTINVEKTFNDMRIDRLLRNHLGKMPQGLIEKNLRNGKIKLNNKKAKSSKKVFYGDKINLFNFTYEEKIIQKKIKYNPSNEVIKEDCMPSGQGIGGINDILPSKTIVDNMVNQASSILKNANNYNIN